MAILSDISAIFSLLPLLFIIYLFIKKVPFSTDIYWVCAFILSKAVLEIYMKITHEQGTAHHDISTFFVFVEYTLIIMVLHSWQNSRKTQNLMLFSIPGFYILSWFLYMSGKISFSANAPDPVLLPIAFTFIFSFSYFTYIMLKQNMDTPFYSNYKTRILVAFILYYVSAVCIYIVPFTNSLEWLRLLFIGNITISIFHNILLILGLYIFSKEQKKTFQPIKNNILS